MSWIGKVLGGAFGFMLGGPLGALAGAAFGHQFDHGLKSTQSIDSDVSEQERIQTAFFTATFAVMGHVAKADGKVTQDEIATASDVMTNMRLNPELKKAAQKLFSEGKDPRFPLDELLDQLRRECHRRHRLLRMFMEIQFQAAFADGVLHPAEKRLLQHIAEKLGFSAREVINLEETAKAERHYQRRPTGRTNHSMSLKDAQTILQISDSTDKDVVKKAYRRMMSQHHPDKLVAKGLPEEMIKVATQKTQEIKKAYDTIVKERQF